MAEILRMPEVAAGATSAKLAEWLVEEGKPFAAADPLATIETDKAIVELSAESDGALLRTLVAAGAEVAVGEPIAVLGRPGEPAGDPGSVLAGTAPTGSAAAAADAAADAAPAAAPDAADAAPAAADAAPAAAHPRTPAAPAGAAGERVFASPIARRLAVQSGLDLAALSGSGPGGRILRRDVEVAIAGRASAPAAAPARAAGAPRPPAAAGAPGTRPLAGAPSTAATFEELPHSRLRRAIAERLTASSRDVPHFSVRGSARVGELLALRTRINMAVAEKVSLTDLVLKAVAFAHTRVPEANVIWTDDAVRRYERVDLGVAIATDGGLVTPVVRDVARLTVSELAVITGDLAARARAGRLYQHEIEGGTCTVSNLGMYGVEEFTAIINPPQSSILAVGAVRQEAVVGADGAVEAAAVLRVTLGVDHRCIDGALAGRWMGELVGALEDPVRLLV